MTLAFVILFLIFAGSLSGNLIAKKDPSYAGFTGIILFSVGLVLSLVMFWTSTTPGALTLYSYSFPDLGLEIPMTFIAGRTESLLYVFVSFTGLGLSLFEYRNRPALESKVINIHNVSVLLLLLLILSSNFLTILIFSSLAGIASVLLIASENRKLFQFKILITTTAGDLLLFSAMLIAWKSSSSFGINEINSAAATGKFTGPAYSAFGILLIAGILLKASAVPFHFWITTDEDVSPRSFRALFAQIFRPTGIIAAIKLAPLLPENLRMVLILIALIGSVLVMVQASYSINLKNTAKYILIGQTGMILSAIVVGSYNTALILLVSSSISWVALEHSLELKERETAAGTVGIKKLIFLSSVLVFSALPLSIGFLGYTQLISSSISFAFYDSTTKTFCLALQILIIFSASFNAFRFLFASNDIRFRNFALPPKEDYPALLGSIFPILGSLFVLVSFNPLFFSGSLLGFDASQQITGGGFGALFPSLLVFAAVSIGAVLSYFYSLKFGPGTAANSKVFATDRSIDNLFAGYLIPGKEEEVKKSNMFKRVADRISDTKELSTFIGYSLLFVVIFYFIFRSL